jgi:type IV pilus assembly protein PilM
MRLNAAKTVVGVDIEPGYVAAVESRAGQVSVDRAATAPLSPGVVKDGEVADVEALAGALRQLFSEHKLGRQVRLGVANQKIVMRTVDLPPMKDEKQITSAVRFQAQDHIPMPLDQAVLQHHLVGLVETAEGPRTRVVLVAARRDMIESLLEVTRRAGLRAQGIDLSAFAMIRALHRPGRTEPTLYVSVGGMTNLAVASSTNCFFTRVVPTGTEMMATELAERRGLTLEHARSWLKHVGLETPIDDVDGEPEIVVEARSVLSDGVRRVADEIRNSLDFHRTQDGSADVVSAVLTGPAVSISGFSEQLGQEIGLPLEVGVPAEGRAGGYGLADPGHLAVAAGLTVNEVPA